MLAVVVTVILAAFVVSKAANKPQSHAGTGVRPDPQSKYPQAMAPSPHQQQQGPAPSLGHTFDGQPLDGSPVVQRINDLAVKALILGIATGVLGIIFGHMARSQIKKTGERGSSLALAGLIIGYVWVGLVVLLIGVLNSTGSRTM
jgi:hypothetical protein